MKEHGAAVWQRGQRLGKIATISCPPSPGLCFDKELPPPPLGAAPSWVSLGGVSPEEDEHALLREAELARLGVQHEEAPLDARLHLGRGDARE